MYILVLTTKAETESIAVAVSVTVAVAVPMAVRSTLVWQLLRPLFRTRLCFGRRSFRCRGFGCCCRRFCRCGCRGFWCRRGFRCSRGFRRSRGRCNSRLVGFLNLRLLFLLTKAFHSNYVSPSAHGEQSHCFCDNFLLDHSSGTVAVPSAVIGGIVRRSEPFDSIHINNRCFRVDTVECIQLGCTTAIVLRHHRMPWKLQRKMKPTRCFSATFNRPKRHRFQLDM